MSNTDFKHTDLGICDALVDLVIHLRAQRPTRDHVLSFNSILDPQSIDDIAFNRGFALVCYNREYQQRHHYVMCHPEDLLRVRQQVTAGVV